MSAKQLAELEAGLTPFLNTAGTPVLRLEKADLRKRHQSESNEAFARLPWLSNAGAERIDREVWDGR